MRGKTGTAIHNQAGKQDFPDGMARRMELDFGEGLDLFPRIFVVIQRKEWIYAADGLEKKLCLQVSDVRAMTWAAGTQGVLNETCKTLGDLVSAEPSVEWRELEIEELDVGLDDPDDLDRGLEQFRTRYGLKGYATSNSKYQLAVTNLESE